MPVDPLITQWKTYKATHALEEYWSKIVPAGTSFDQSDAVALVMTMLDHYESTLRKIAEKGGPDAGIAQEALDYKAPVWR